MNLQTLRFLKVSVVGKYIVSLGVVCRYPIGQHSVSICIEELYLLKTALVILLNTSGARGPD